jgi:predicted nuclease of predicted toxin-antitoxin system
MLPDTATFWIDHNLPKALAIFITNFFGFDAFSFLDLKLDKAEDAEVYRRAALNKNIVIVTKDKDFVNLCLSKGAPPKIIWITLGNSTNKQLKEIFQSTFEDAISKLRRHDIVEISNSI